MELSKFNWLRCSSNTCSSRLAKIDTPPVSFLTANLPELKDVRAISELKVPAGWVERIPGGRLLTVGFSSFFLLKHYRAGNDMKYAYIEWSNIRTNHLQNPTTKNHFSKHSERSFQKSLRFPWEQRHSSPTYKRGDFPDGGFAVPIRSIASNSEFLYNAFESIRLPMLGALLASGKKKEHIGHQEIGVAELQVWRGWKV